MTADVSNRYLITWFSKKSAGGVPELTEIDELAHAGLGGGFIARMMHAAADNPALQIRVGIDNEMRVAGFLIALQVDLMEGERTSCRLLELRRLSVHPSCWRQGLGRALVGDRVTYASQRGMDAVTVVVPTFNVQAAEFFRTLGFRAHRVIKSTAGVSTAVRFVRRLTDRPLNLD